MYKLFRYTSRTAQKYPNEVVVQVAWVANTHIIGSKQL